MVAIGANQSLIISALYKHRCLENSNNLYKTTGKFDDQQKYKETIKAEMVSTPGGCTKERPMIPNPSMSTKNPIEREALCQFTETLEIKHKHQSGL